MTKSFNWAAKTLLELAKIPATTDYIKAITESSSANQQWIYALVKTAQPQVGSMTSSFYNQAIEILIANGVNVNPYSNGSG